MNTESNNSLPIPGSCFKVILPDKEKPICLTQRESMIVALMMIGHRAKQIAWKLDISLHTVNSHMANIKQKLDCSTNFEVGYCLGWFKFYQEQHGPKVNLA